MQSTTNATTTNSGLPFWQTINASPLWSGLFSALFVAVLFSLFFPWIAELWKRQFNKPRLYLWNAQTNDASCTLRRRALNEWGKPLEASVKNDSRSAVNHAYYSIAIPNGLGVNYTEIPDSGVTITRRDGLDWTFLSGEITKPIYPSRQFRFPFALDLMATVPGAWDIYYCFSTERGMSPQKATHLPMGEEINRDDMKKYFDKFIVKTG